jgi:hypothetical protein
MSHVLIVIIDNSSGVDITVTKQKPVPEWLEQRISYEVDAPPQAVADALQQQFLPENTPTSMRAVISQPDETGDYTFQLEHDVPMEHGQSTDAILYGRIYRDGGRDITRVTGRITLNLSLVKPVIITVMILSLIGGIVFTPGVTTLLDRVASGIMLSAMMGVLTVISYVLIFLIMRYNGNRLIRRLEASLDRLPTEHTQETTRTQHLTDSVKQDETTTAPSDRLSGQTESRHAHH